MNSEQSLNIPMVDLNERSETIPPITINPPLPLFASQKPYDNPISIAPNAIISTPNNVYSIIWVKRTVETYTFFLFLEYLSFFSSLPFDNIKNRPSICTVSEFFLLVTVAICISLLPIAASTLPNKLSYWSHFICSIAQLVCFILYIVCVVSVFTLKEQMTVRVYQNDESMTDRDITSFVKWYTCVALAIIGCTLIASIISTAMYGRALYRLINRKARTETFTDDSEPVFREGDTIVDHHSITRGDVIFSRDVIQHVTERFV